MIQSANTCKALNHTMCKICEVQNAPVQWAPISIYLIRGCSHITSAAGRGEGVRQMLTIADEGGRGVTQKLTNADEGGYNFVSKIGFRQPKMCEKETIYVNLVLLCKAKTKHRSKTHLSPLKCHVKKCFCLNLNGRSGKGDSGKCWRRMTRGEGGSGKC